MFWIQASLYNKRGRLGISTFFGWKRILHWATYTAFSAVTVTVDHNKVTYSSLWQMMLGTTAIAPFPLFCVKKFISSLRLPSKFILPSLPTNSHLFGRRAYRILAHSSINTIRTCRLGQLRLLPKTRQPKRKKRTAVARSFHIFFDSLQCLWLAEKFRCCSE